MAVQDITVKTHVRSDSDHYALHAGLVQLHVERHFQFAVVLTVIESFALLVPS